MSLVREIEIKCEGKPWKTISSVKKLKQHDNKWVNEHYNYTYHQEPQKAISRLTSEQTFQKLKENEKLIQISKVNCESTLTKMLKTVLFLLTDSNGVVLGIYGPEILIKEASDNFSLKLGAIISSGEIGINAINISIATQEWVYMNGAEYDFRLFGNWSSFCQPIRQNEKIIGYLNLSFSTECDHLLIATIFSLTVKSIETDLNKQDPKMMIYEKLKQHRLSPREREIGYYWTKNYSALRIASELGISEGTVRNVIKKIYRKTDSADKGHFISKFIV